MTLQEQNTIELLIKEIGNLKKEVKSLRDEIKALKPIEPYTLFDDLVFKEHRNKAEGCVQAILDLPNGFTLSVVGGPGLYGDGINDFEVACWTTEGQDWIKIGEQDEVLGWQSKQEVNEIIQKVLQMNLL